MKIGPWGMILFLFLLLLLFFFFFLLFSECRQSTSFQVCVFFRLFAFFSQGTKSHLTIYDVLDNPYYCGIAKYTFGNCPNNLKKPAVKTCFPTLRRRFVTSCLGQHAIHAFSLCLQAVCYPQVKVKRCQDLERLFKDINGGCRTPSRVKVFCNIQ